MSTTTRNVFVGIIVGITLGIVIILLIMYPITSVIPKVKVVIQKEVKEYLHSNEYRVKSLKDSTTYTFEGSMYLLAGDTVLVNQSDLKNN